MTKQEEENAPVTAPAESRAAPPPVLGYYVPQRDNRDHSRIGLISVICPLLALLLGLIGSGFEGTHVEIAFEGISILFIFFGFGCAILGIRQRSTKQGFAVLGLVMNGAFVIKCVFLVLLILWRI